MTFAFSAESQTLTIYHYDATTGEFLVSDEEVIPAYTGLPASSTEIAPPAAQTGYAYVFSAGAWSQVEDHRGTTVYVKASRVAVVVTTLGSLLDTVTETAPTSDYDVWDSTSGAWVVDAAAKLAADSEAAEQQKNTLMATATLQIEIYGDAVAAETTDDTTTSTNALMLAAWKAYRVALNEVDTSAPDSITWPTVPTKASVTAAS